MAGDVRRSLIATGHLYRSMDCPISTPTTSPAPAGRRYMGCLQAGVPVGDDVEYVRAGRKNARGSASVRCASRIRLRCAVRFHGSSSLRLAGGLAALPVREQKKVSTTGRTRAPGENQGIRTCATMIRVERERFVSAGARGPEEESRLLVSIADARGWRRGDRVRATWEPDAPRAKLRLGAGLTYSSTEKELPSSSPRA